MPKDTAWTSVTVRCRRRPGEAEKRSELTELLPGVHAVDDLLVPSLKTRTASISPLRADRPCSVARWGRSTSPIQGWW